MKTFSVKLDGPMSRIFLDTFSKTLISLGFVKGEEIRNPEAPDLYEFVQDGFRVLVTDEEEAGLHRIEITSRDGDVAPLIEKTIRALITHIINLFSEKGLLEIEKLRECITS